TVYAPSLDALPPHPTLFPSRRSSDLIPHRTQERIRIAARELNYRPNFMARSLRAQRSFTVGVVVPEISEGYAALVMSGIEDHLRSEEHTSELQSPYDLVCRLLLEKIN